MTPIVIFFTKVLSLITLVFDVGIVLLFVAFLTKRAKFSRTLLAVVGRRATTIGFFIALGSFAGSLFYSEFAGFTPCTLCWTQRIFMYPLVLIFAVGFWKRNEKIFDFGLWFSLGGALVAAYHTYLQFGGVSFVPCSAGGISCSQRFFVEYEYITIPTMALSSFLLIMLAMVAAKYTYRQSFR